MPWNFLPESYNYYLYLSIIYYYMYTLYCSNKKKNINKSWPHLFQNESTAKQMAFPLSETKVEMAYVDNWWRKLRLTRKRSLIYFVELWNNCRGKSFFCLKTKTTISQTKSGQTNTCTCNMQLVVLSMCTFYLYHVNVYFAENLHDWQWIFGWKCS